MTWSLIGALLALAATAGVATWMNRAQTRRILFANTPASAAPLGDCLARRWPLAGGWEIETGPPEQRHGWNAAHDVRVDIIDHGASRRLDVSTPGARALRDDEAAALRACLAGDR